MIIAEQQAKNIPSHPDDHKVMYLVTCEYPEDVQVFGQLIKKARGRLR